MPSAFIGVLLVMNVLYYCQEYYRPFGPSTHAREFFSEMQKLAGVNKCKVIPEQGALKSVQRTAVDNSEASLKRKIARIIVPRWIRLILLFTFPKKSVWEMINNELSQGDWDALVMRPDWALMWVPRLKRRFPRVRVVLEINAAMFDEGFKEVPWKWFWKRVEARAVNSADYVTTVSQNLKDYLVSHGVRGEKICVNPNGVNLEKFDASGFSVQDRKRVREELGVKVDAVLFGYVGGMQPFRRLPEMVDLFLELIDARKLDGVLLLIGDGEDMSNVIEVQSCYPERTRNHLIVLGSKPYEEIPAYVNSFDVAVFPFSNPYGSPQKLFEYMAMGVPVFGPKVPVVEETFTDGEHLMLVDQHGGDDFKMMLLWSVGSYKELKRIALAGKEYVSREYTWKKNAERVFALLAR